MAYYRYTGDPAAIGLIALTADYLLDYCQTPADHAWPNFIISAPVKGKAFGRANPHGFIQLDLCGQLGSAVLAAYKLTGNPRYLEAVTHWADLLAEHCDLRPGVAPWNRYANPKDCPWDTQETAGMSLTLQFLNDMIQLGYRGKGDALVKARDAGEKYFRDVLLPEWSRDPTFGHHFWDWDDPVYTCAVPGYTAQYIMDRREAFPQWKSDIRNFMSMFLCRSSVDPASAGDVYSGALGLSRGQQLLRQVAAISDHAHGGHWARYAVLADDAWAREIARRQSILTTYDAHETGVVEDRITGGVEVTGVWFNLAHPWPFRVVMEMLAWQPETLGPARENHIMRSSSVVRAVRYGKGRIAYSTFDAPAPCEDVLRLAFTPAAVSADGKPLPLRQELSQNGFTVKPLTNGDYIVTIRHDGCRDIVVEGDDPQETLAHDRLHYEGPWATEEFPAPRTASSRSLPRQAHGRGSISQAIRSASSAGPIPAAARPTCTSTASSNFAASISGAPRPAISRSSVTRTAWPRASTAWRSWPWGEESRLDRHAGLSERRPVLCRAGGKRLRARRAAQRRRSASSSATWAARTTSIPPAMSGGRQPSSSCDWVPWSTWCRRPSGRSRNSTRWAARPIPNFTATASTAATSPRTSPWRPSRPITCG